MSIIGEEQKDREADACPIALQEVTPYTGHAERIQIRDAIICERKNTQARYLEKKARITEQLRQLQATLSMLERDFELQTSRWDSRLNSVVPFIHRLPEDVLCRIFLTTVHSSSRHTQWKSITAVCSQWRRLTLGYPLLWTQPDFYNTKVGKSMATLARSIPLDLSVNTDMGFQNMGTALEYLRSAWRLSFTVDSSSALGTVTVDDIFNFIPLIRPAPALKALEVEFDSRLSPAVLPENLFAGQAPCLRTIYLRQCNLPWTSEFVGLFSSITTLRLRMETGAQRRLDTAPFHTVMSQLRLLLQLKVLELHDVFSRLEGKDTAYFDGRPDLVFNNLEQLAIQASSPVCELIFAHFDYPSTASVKISGLFPENEADDGEFNEEHKYSIKSIRRLLTTIFSKTSSLHSLTIGHLGRKAHFHYGGLHYQLKFITKEQASEAQRTKDEKRSYFRIGLPNVPGLLKGIWKSVPMEELKYFRYLLHQSDNGMWEIFSVLPNLRSVAISGNHDGFFRMLKSDAGCSSRQPQKEANLKLGFASVTDLRLFDMRFHRRFRRIGHSNTYHTEDQNILFDDFCALIKERIALDFGLEILYLENCDTVELDQLEELRHVIGRMEWKDLNKHGKKICRVSI